MEYYIYNGIANDAASRQGSVTGFEIGALLFVTASAAENIFNIYNTTLENAKTEYFARFFDVTYPYQGP
jgi:hypothetical protein